MTTSLLMRTISKRNQYKSTMKSLRNLKVIITLLLYFYSINNSPKCQAYYSNLDSNYLSEKKSLPSGTSMTDTFSQYDHSSNNIHEYSDYVKHDPVLDNHLMMSSLNDALSSSSLLSPSSLSSSSSSSSASVSSASHTDLETHRCEPLTLILCKGMYYEYTRLPNMFHHETQEEAGLEVIHIFYHHVVLYVNVLKAGCSPIMEHYKFPWPERMNCEQFPEYNNPNGILCMERNLTHEEEKEEKKEKTNELQLINNSKKQKSITSFNQSSIIHLDNLSKDTKMITSNLHSTNNLNHIHIETLTTLEEIELKHQFNVNASNILFEKSIINEDLRKLKSIFPNLHLKCTCDCRPPLINMKYFDIHTNEKSTTTNNNYSSNNWFDLNTNNINNNNIKSVTHSPTTLTTMTLKTGDITTMMMDSTRTSTSTIVSNLVKSTNQLIRSKLLRYALTGRASCAAVFLFIYFFSMAASVWWVVLAFTWLLAAGLKWGSEAISKYSQVFHFIAWSLPASQTALALLLSVVEGDPISGLCTIQSNKSISLILFTFCPLVIYLSIGIILMMIGFIALYRIRDTIKLQRPRIIEIYKLDKLILRIGIYGILYTIPNIIILFTIGYELHNTTIWQLGIACHCHYDIDYIVNNDMPIIEPILPIPLPVWNPPKPQYAIFMLKHFMSLIIGITSGFWIWSNKTIESWRRFCFHSKCLFKFNKYNSSSGLLVNTNGLDHDILHKQHIEQWKRIPLNTSSQITSQSINTPMKSILNHIDNNEYCRKLTWKQSTSTSYDLINNNQLMNINISTPSTLFSTHSYDVPIHDRNTHNLHYKTSFGAYYSIDESNASQQYGDVNSYHTNNSTTNINNSSIDNKGMISNTRSYVTQLSGNSINPGFSTLSSSLNSPQKSSIPQLINNNNNSNNTNNNSSSISTGFSSSGIGSVQPNDGLTRTASMFTNSELNSNHISPKLMEHYFNDEQRSYEVIGTQITTSTTTTTTTTTTTDAIVLSVGKYDHNNDLRRDNHSVGANQFISNMFHENRKNNLLL
ncbi:hypothetical protein MN116_002693 [Schistosoma mekongi]|uniref:G-protein coupled receptors family 2 profile 2 domain-containing protein n=1 Tax=Schistosoma mekongi TaxID=38744 RepID=A0AAE2D5W5_SCHME|nr:hypothetical protein MN116_002693 [Schistosoma mekongi]